jgi:septum formation protein
MSAPRIVLASASPRRKEILSGLGIAFEIRPTHVNEEALDVDDDERFVEAVARLKLRHALSGELQDGQYVLAADTIVCIGGDRLGKPADEEEALAMLQRLSGRDHLVRTSVALGREGEGELGLRTVVTRVWFRPASDDELRRYVALGESYDKAGAYGIQGAASGFVRKIEGSYSNVVGLPAAEVVELLIEHQALERWP